ncbi:MAG: YhdP family protein [Pseudomonadales bacterium]
MTRLVLRPLFVFLTLAMLVMAFFQVSGRLLFSFLDDLEVGINQWLAPQGVSLHGLEGDWRLIDPVIRIVRVTLPAGELSGVEVEIDWLESLIRNRPIAKQVALEDGRLLLERGANGWQLLGTRAGGRFDPFDTLYHSDHIDAALTLGFVGDDGEAREADDLRLHYLAANRGGQHRHRLTLGNTVCPEAAVATPPAAGGTPPACTLTLALDEQEAMPLLWPRRFEARVSGGGIDIPEPLLAGSGGRVDALEGTWWRSGEASGGEARVHLADLSMNDDVLSGGFELVSRGDGDLHHLELRELTVANGDDRWELPDFWLTLEAGDETSALKIWTDRLETGPGFEFLTALAPRESAVFRWLNGLNVRATALNVHAYVRFPDLLTGYLATVRDVSLDGYNGAPWIRGAAGELLGANRTIRLSLNADDLGVQFPEVFHQRWHMDHLSGRLQAYVSGDYFGFKGSNLRAMLGGSHAVGAFALTRPRDDPYRERLSLLISVDQTTVAEAKEYVPYRLPEGLPEWLDAGPRAGNLFDVLFAYQGQIHTRPFELARRVAFSARIEEGYVQYHPDWPAVSALAGRIGVGGSDVRIAVDAGISQTNSNLAGSRIRLTDNATYADIDLKSDTTVADALSFIRETPLINWMGFVLPDWSGDGPLTMAGRLRVPLKMGEEHIGQIDALQVNLDIDLAGADLDLPSYGVSLGALQGRVHYEYPYAVSAADVRGRLFERTAIFGASSDADTVTFHVDGQAPYEDVLALLDIQDPGGIQGGFDFTADLHVEMGEEVTRLDVISDLTGLTLEAPGELAKAADDAVPSELTLSFLDDYQSVRFRYGSARGWMHVDGVPLRGAVGFSAPPPVVDAAGDTLVLGGRIAGFSLDEVVPDRAAAGEPPGERGSLPIPVELVGLEAGVIDVNGVLFRDARLDGRIGSGPEADVSVTVDSPDLQGQVLVPSAGPLELDLKLLRLPAAEASSGDDPLDVGIMQELVDANVSVARFLVGDLDYGRWAFALRPEAGGVALLDLDAELRGVRIASERLYWDGTSNESHFPGTLTATDLAEVLPQWGYAASVSTEQAAMEADLRWRGSPAAVDLERLVGTASFKADDGRFLEVTQGADAMKIFSLVNFSKIARRLNFDFSDVVGEGVSFDTLTATTEFQEGTMQFLEPMSVQGSGSSFRVAGTVDLVEGRLDNEMIVTLPVTKGLPWYAAYVALANPLAGLGVLVGERVLRKPLEQFSSAKYEVSGTLEDPVLKFVSVWDTSMDQPATLEPATRDIVPAAPEGVPATPPGEGDVRPVEETTAQNTGS